MARLTWESVLAWRMRRQHLAERVSTRRALAVVSDVCGLHAQVTSSAELTLWARVDGLQRGWMEDQLWKRRRLVKTWAMRGTLHLLRADELALYTGALARLRPRYDVPAWQRALRRRRTRRPRRCSPPSPRSWPGRRGRAPSSPPPSAARAGTRRWRRSSRAASASCSSPPRSPATSASRRPTGSGCASPARRAGSTGSRHPGPDEASAHEVVRRYLRAYGPAPREQFRRWFGMTSPAEAGRWLQALADEVEEVDVEGARGWMLAADVAEAAAAEPAGVVRLLPAFDHYVVAAPRDAEAVLPAGRRAEVYRPQGWLSPVILADGRDLGIWEHAASGTRSRVTLSPVRAVRGARSARRRGGGRAARRLPRRTARSRLSAEASPFARGGSRR